MTAKTEAYATAILLSEQISQCAFNASGVTDGCFAGSLEDELSRLKDSIMSGNFVVDDSDDAVNGGSSGVSGTESRIDRDNNLRTDSGEIFAHEIQLEEVNEYFRMAEEYLKNGGRASYVQCRNDTVAVVFEKDPIDFDALLSEITPQTGFVEGDQADNMIIHRSADDNELKKTLSSHWEAGCSVYENNKGDIVVGSSMYYMDYVDNPLTLAKKNFRSGGIAYFKPSSGMIVFAQESAEAPTKMMYNFCSVDKNSID